MPDGHAYVTDNGGGSVTVLDPSSHATQNIPQGDFPSGISALPSGKQVFVSNTGSGTVLVIDTYTNKMVANLPAGRTSLGNAVSPDSNVIGQVPVGVQP
ncbi:hypothetical protein SSP35_28_00350 [Streptomyces sp. NBRC 110611]|uniref:YncE family protein n=1 Tax=Streptomyces sp. NBRC 110611 TaxID=1621259 RepID=UPI000858524D|nr:hypothetical protein [Streptomyces sp. NBRC 110611]GAU71159.1 hypothetical protein SSP35_28_00350 [Streptomyces sp. NBRC 110611]